MSSSLAVSLFLTMNHCEQAAFNFTMNTLKKCDSLEVEVESSCHVKTLGRKERNGCGVKRGERRTQCTFYPWTWTVDTSAAVLLIVCLRILQYWSSLEDISYYWDPRSIHKVTNCFKSWRTYGTTFRNKYNSVYCLLESCAVQFYCCTAILGDLNWKCCFFDYPAGRPNSL